MAQAKGKYTIDVIGSSDADAVIRRIADAEKSTAIEAKKATDEINGQEKRIFSLKGTIQGMSESWTEVNSKISIVRQTIGKLKEIADTVWSGLKEGADFADLRRLFAEIPNAAEKLNALRDATRGAVDDQTLFRVGLAFQTAGINAEQFGNVAAVALDKSIKSGEDFASVATQWAKAMAGHEYGPFKEIGIIVKDDTALFSAMASRAVEARDNIESSRSTAYAKLAADATNMKLQFEEGVAVSTAFSRATDMMFGGMSARMAALQAQLAELKRQGQDTTAGLPYGTISAGADFETGLRIRLLEDEIEAVLRWEQTNTEAIDAVKKLWGSATGAVEDYLKAIPDKIPGLSTLIDGVKSITVAWQQADSAARTYALGQAFMFGNLKALLNPGAALWEALDAAAAAKPPKPPKAPKAPETPRAARETYTGGLTAADILAGSSVTQREIAAAQALYEKYQKTAEIFEKLSERAKTVALTAVEQKTFDDSVLFMRQMQAQFQQRTADLAKALLPENGTFFEPDPIRRAISDAISGKFDVDIRAELMKAVDEAIARRMTFDNIKLVGSLTQEMQSNFESLTGQAFPAADYPFEVPGISRQVRDFQYLSTLSEDQLALIDPKRIEEASAAVFRLNQNLQELLAIRDGFAELAATFREVGNGLQMMSGASAEFNLQKPQSIAKAMSYLAEAAKRSVEVEGSFKKGSAIAHGVIAAGAEITSAFVGDYETRAALLGAFEFAEGVRTAFTPGEQWQSPGHFLASGLYFAMAGGAWKSGSGGASPSGTSTATAPDLVRPSAASQSGAINIYVGGSIVAGDESAADWVVGLLNGKAAKRGVELDARLIRNARR